jgi:RNA polymerase sigma factor (sigma-70 family)
MSGIKQFEILSDLEIVARVLSGEIALYEIIMRRYNPYLFKIGRSYGFNQPDTEDLIQDSYLNAYTNLEKFENRSTLKTWLVKIMLNNCYHKTKKFSYKYEIPSDISEKNTGIPMFMQQTHTGKTIMNNELKNILEEALVQIPESYRMVFTLRELNGMSTRETAETLNISEANVKVRLKRAKDMLRNEIKKMYSPEDIFEFNLIYCNRIVENVLTRIQEKNN